MLSEATTQALTVPASTIALPSQLVKGRDTPVVAYKLTQLAQSGAPVAAAGPTNP